MYARNHQTAPLLPVTTDWLGALSIFIKGLKTCEFDTVDALLGAVAGDDPAAGLMLKRVLVWHTSKSGGEFHLSQRDWWRQCRVNRKTIDRVKTKIFPLCGITVEVKSTAHGKATHYRLHEMKFLRRLAQVINLPLVFIVNRLRPKGTDGYVQNGQMGMSESDAPLTIESTIETSNDVVKNNVVPSKKIVDFKSPLPESTSEQLRVIDLLKEAGVWGNTAVVYCTLPEPIVQDCIAYAQSAVEAKRVPLNRRVPYLVGALKKQLEKHKAQPLFESAVNDAPPPDPLPIEREVEGIAHSHQTNFTADTPREKPGDYLRRLEAEAAQVKAQEPVNERLAVMVNERTTALEAWSYASHQFELQDKHTFTRDLWDARLIDYEPNCFVVHVHSTHARDWLQHRHQVYKHICRILSGICGREMTVRFEADEAESPDAPLQRFLRRHGDGN